MDEHSVLGRTIREITSNLKEKITSASEITQSHIDQIKKVNGSLNAVVQITETEALEQAENLDKSMANGNPVGALHGIPMTLKDSLDTKGIIKRQLINKKCRGYISYLRGENPINFPIRLYPNINSDKLTILPEDAPNKDFFGRSIGDDILKFIITYLTF